MKTGDFYRGKCRHFNGVQHQTCEAGHSYQQVRVERADVGEGESIFPCLNADLSDRCAGHDVYTEEEAVRLKAETDRFVAEFLRRSMVVRPKIVEHIGDRRNEYVADAIPCPICEDGQVAYAYHGHYNGHIHATCTTEGCVQWVE